MQHTYATRHRAVTRTLTDHFTHLTELVPSAAGMHVPLYTRGLLGPT
ncbi:hypothetical protein ACWD1Z_35275 [Streptomyces sp. NPDC002784]